MSGYLEVKYPSKSNLGLNPFKSWKRQWCILRPSPTCSGGSLAVYCSEAGAAAGTVELPSTCVVRRAKSRSRPYAFAVFPTEEPRKPRVLLAALTLQEAQTWMEKIQALLNGDKLLGTERLLKDSYSVTVVSTELSRKCGVAGDCSLSVCPGGALVCLPRTSKFIPWTHITDVLLITDTDKSRICVVNVDSEFPEGGGELRLCTPLAGELASALRQARRSQCGAKLSRSDGDLRARTDSDLGEVRRSSWYSGPSEVSLDDIDLVMYKECQRAPAGRLSRCNAAGDLAQPRPHARDHNAATTTHTTTTAAALDDSMSDRRSLLSVSSGIYEEIPDLPAEADVYCTMARGGPVHTALPPVPPVPAANMCAVEAAIRLEEPTYESVADCVYATMRRAGRRAPPPPLPPRVPCGPLKGGESWHSRLNSSPAECVSRHGSLGSLPRCCSVGAAAKTATKTRPPFSVFRKRLKSDSRLATSPKSDTSKENKDVETKKKKFDFTPTRDIFKNFKVSRKMKNLKIASGLTKGETKSCEFLDETEHVTTNRCSKSVECLENDEFVDADFSIEFNDDAVAALALPQEIVDLILRGREQLNKIRLKETQVESEYEPMSPIVPPVTPIDHYIVMSPKTNLA